MKKFQISLISILLCFILCFQALAVGFPTYEELKNIEVEDFADVHSSDWYYDDIRLARAATLVEEMDNNNFAPNSYTTVAQVIKIAVVAHEIYYDMDWNQDVDSTPWYATFVDRAKEYGILSDDYPDYDAKISRAEAVSILFKAVPEEYYSAINTIDSIPDVDETDSYYHEIYTWYAAGILEGNDRYGTFLPESNIKRCELIAILMRMILTEKRESFVLDPLPEPSPEPSPDPSPSSDPAQTIKTITYGKSAEGRTLTAYQLGTGKNVLMLTFAIHGWEDHWDADGEELVWCAEQLKADLEANYSTYLGNNDWTVYILPCLNPDGIASGTTNYGSGRCTTYYYTDSSMTTLSNEHGIDMNRCFPTGWSKLTGARNYTGTFPLACPEAQAVASFMKSHVSSTGENVFIDVHGWFSQIITEKSYNTLHKIFKVQFSGNSWISLGNKGYIADYADTLGFDAMLFEFPASVKNHATFVPQSTKFIECIHQILLTY